MTINRDVFDELFTLELANNHRGSVERGLRIISDFATVVRFNNVRAAIKLQFRDVDRSSIVTSGTGHPLHQEDARYQDAAGGFCRDDPRDPGERLHPDGHAVRRVLGRPVCRARPSDHQDRQLRHQRLDAHREDRDDPKPVIVSTGGSSLKDIDDLVTFFANRNIPLAINHCVSLYPSEDADLELNQIDFLSQPLPRSDGWLVEP